MVQPMLIYNKSQQELLGDLKAQYNIQLKRVFKIIRQIQLFKPLNKKLIIHSQL